MTASTNIDSGVEISNLSPGSQVEVQTKSRNYHIEALGGFQIRISGHPRFCPNPTLGELQGSAAHDGSLHLGVIEPGRHLVFMIGKDFPVTTSEVVSVHVESVH